MIQKIADRLEEQIKENLFELELLDKKRAEKVRSSKEYEEYIKSNEWQETRQKIFKRDNFRCVKCGCSKNLQVHHITYENLSEEKDADLVTLCEKCHNGTHNLTTIDYLALACAEEYRTYTNSTSEGEKAKAKYNISIISQIAENISNPLLTSTPDYILLFAYAIRMGESYFELDDDLKLDESLYPPDIKKIIGDDLNSVIDKTRIKTCSEDVRLDLTKAYYFHFYENIMSKRIDWLKNARNATQDEERKKQIDEFLNKAFHIKEKAIKYYGDSL